MSTLHEAAQLALEALEYGQHSIKQISEYQWESRGQLAMDALKAALAQPEPAQEPVAWATEIIDALQAQYDTEMIKENDSGDALIRLDDAIAAVEDAEKHYTAPQPQRKPLTDEDIRDAVQEADLDWQAGWTLDEHEPNRFTTLARAIERKVRGE